VEQKEDVMFAILAITQAMMEHALNVTTLLVVLAGARHQSRCTVHSAIMTRQSVLFARLAITQAMKERVVNAVPTLVVLAETRYLRRHTARNAMMTRVYV